MRYAEHAPPRLWPVWLAVLFAVLLLPHYWLPELSYGEARHTLVAQEMVATGEYLSPHLFGDRVFAFPGAPWLLALAAHAWPLNEFTVRLLGLAPLALLVLLCGWLSWRLAGAHAGAVTAAATMSMVGVAFQKGTVGDEALLFALLVTSAWLAWYWLGRVHKRWFFAWFAAHLLTFLATLAGGATAIVFLYFPLLWLRRPLRIGRRLTQVQHWVSLALLGALVALWLALAPDLRDELVTFFASFAPREVAHGYFAHLVRFPGRTLAGALPWLLLAWPTFCVAFRPLEREPIFCGYLRTILTATFFLLWLAPLGRAAPVLPLVGPLAILIGMNYDLLVRRYGPELLKLVPVLCWLALLAAGAWVTVSVVFHDLPAYRRLPASVAYGETTAIAGAVLLAGVLLLWRRPRLPVWLLLLLAVVACRLVYSGTYVVYYRAAKETARNVAARLTPALPPADQPLYLLFSRNRDEFTAEWYYLRHPLIRKKSLDDLADSQTIHVLGEGLEPIARDRQWTPLTPTLEYHDRNQFRLWKGVLRERVFQWEARNLPLTRRVGVWPSTLPAGKNAKILKQDQTASRPLLTGRVFAGKPAVRFTGREVLHQTDPGLGREIGDEYTIVMVLTVRPQGTRQTLLDITEVENGEAVLQRLVYLPASTTLIARCGGADGRVNELKTTANLGKPSVVVVRRDSKAFHIAIDDKDTSLAIPGQTGLGARQYVVSVGATWDGRRFTDYLDGDLAELRIYNQAVSDERRQAMVQSLRQAYLEPEAP